MEASLGSLQLRVPCLNTPTYAPENIEFPESVEARVVELQIFRPAGEALGLVDALLGVAATRRDCRREIEERLTPRRSRFHEPTQSDAQIMVSRK